MKKIILQLSDRHGNNTELLDIRNRFQEKIKELGGIDNCRENPELIKELEETEQAYDKRHDSIIDRFLYHGTVHWIVEKYDETKEIITIYKLNDGGERLRKKPIEEES